MKTIHRKNLEMEKSKNIKDVYSERTIRTICASLVHNELEYNSEREVLKYWKSVGKNELRGMDWALENIIKKWKQDYQGRTPGSTEVRALLFDNLCQYDE